MSTPTSPNLPTPTDAVGDYRIDLTRLLYMLYMDSEQQLARCDMKANLILTANSILLAVAASIAVNYLKNAPPTGVLIIAASMLIPLLALNDLVDEYSLHVYPVMLGGGKRLYPEGKRINLTLVEASPLPSGVVFMRYRRA